MEQNRRRQEEQSNIDWTIWGSVAAGIGVAIGGASLLYLAIKEDERRQLQAQGPRIGRPRIEEIEDSPSVIRQQPSIAGYLQMPHNISETVQHEMVRCVPNKPEISNLNSLLHDIYVRYTGVKSEDFEKHYYVFEKIFYRVHKKMKDVDKYYRRYSSMVQFAGSHYDRLRIKKPDEFDMDVVINLPLSIKTNPWVANDSDFIIQPKDAGFVHLKMGAQFHNLPMRDGVDWEINKTAYKWKDEDGYLLRSKFLDWFKGVVVRALNELERNKYWQTICEVDGVEYTIDRSESGPAITLIIRDRTSGFRIDVDLVPALKFPEDRWPPGPDYRDIPLNCKKDYWLVVPKPNKTSICGVSKTRSWRVALHYQERELMNSTSNLRVAIKLLKKLRDSQRMNAIYSYYIKTLVFWEIQRTEDASFWTKNPATIFKLLVKRLHEATVNGSIPYFWNEQYNLIEDVNRQLLNEYAAKLSKFMRILENPEEYKQVAKYLLMPEEFAEYAKFL